MTTVVQLPPSLDDRTFEQVLDKVAPLGPDENILLDARHSRWASPYGLTAILTLAQAREKRMGFAVPELDDTASYWARTGFFRHAEALYDLVGSYPRRQSGGESSVLLEITPIVKSDDVHDVVGKIQQKAQQILTGELKNGFLHARSIVFACPCHTPQPPQAGFLDGGNIVCDQDQHATLRLI